MSFSGGKKELVEATRRVFADILAPEDDVLFQVGHYYKLKVKCGFFAICVKSGIV